MNAANRNDRAMIYLGLGANTGNRAANLRSALRRLQARVEIVAVSSLYETAPVGPAGQPPFFNAVCSGLTTLSPLELLHWVKRIEQALGRRPTIRWGPRPLDIDILLWNAATVETATLQIPHPRLAERSFVLEPLCELAPELEVPGVGEPVAILARRLRAGALRRVAARGWEQR